jgi:hypothetical protein
MLSLPLLLASTTLAAAPFVLDTAATRSDYKKTGRIDEVVAACAAAEKAGARCETVMTTPEGRPMPMITIGDTKKPVVLVIGGIHAGEIDGKDAALFVISELLNNKRTLGDVAVAFVPVYNVDGHERRSKNNRPNQRGPEEMGFRVTSQNLNLNRDWTKANAPETRGLLAVINRLDPVLTVDLHVTDGAQFQHDISVMVEPSVDDGTAAAVVVEAKKLSASLQSTLKNTGHLPLDFYPAFEVDDDPSSGIAVGVPPARFTNGYAAKRGRLGILVETHSWQPYKARVQATIDLLHGVLDDAQKNARAWRTAADSADAAQRALPGKNVVLRFEPDMDKKATFPFQGYAYTRTPSEISGALWTRYDEKKKEVWNIPLWATQKPTSTTTAPAAYAVLPGYAGPVVERLLAHGISFTRLSAPQTTTASTWTATAVTFGAKPYEGQMTAKATGAWSQTSTSTTLPAGTLIVPVAQARGRLVLELFEPEASESLVAWGFLNAAFEQKEYMEAYVAESEARAMLAKDPALRAAFIDKLKTDAAFAKDPEARLNFFYVRHPAWDARKDTVPILRLDAVPAAP